MDPVSASAWASSLARSSTSFQVQVAVAKKAMDSERAQGDAMVELIRQAAEVGESLSTGEAGSIDVYA
ncbi:MAG: YjfB family protein [Phycisphaerae bacterium]|nr:YjfB family protein [Phycisphaerae bacterium]